MIYLLEDDESIRKLVIYALNSQGFEACGFETPEKFWEAMAKENPQLILLDIMLPGEDGISILRKIRSQGSKTPVIMLTAKNSEYDRVEGLDAGADDYISKPFGIMELIARVRAVLRRTEQTDAATRLVAGPLEVYPQRYEVKADGNDVTLTYKEFMLLCLLMENEGVVMTRETLLSKVWGLGGEPENRTLDVHIRTLRAKLGAAGSCIQTVRGVGYRLVGNSE